MTPIVVNEGELDMLAVLKAGIVYKIGLFKNNVTVVDTTVLADLTEADFSGYGAAQTLVFGTPFTDGSGRGKMTAATITFTHSGGATANTVYGSFIKDSTTGKLLKAETWDTPFLMNTAGQFVTLDDSELVKGTIT
jgi:hypothetical protein